jgi:hypothetical protein
MPLRRLILVALCASFLGLGGYALIATALQYFEVQELVDAALVEAFSKRRFVSSMQRPIDSREIAHEVRAGHPRASAPDRPRAGGSGLGRDPV